MNKTDKELRKQIEKWKERLDQKLEKENFSHEEMKNVRAYRSDTDHFLEEKDYIRAWESIVYAWGILETLERIDEIK